jgi:hypothetical protein
VAKPAISRLIGPSARRVRADVGEPDRQPDGTESPGEPRRLVTLETRMESRQMRGWERRRVAAIRSRRRRRRSGSCARSGRRGDNHAGEIRRHSGELPDGRTASVSPADCVKRCRRRILIPSRVGCQKSSSAVACSAVTMPASTAGTSDCAVRSRAMSSSCLMLLSKDTCRPARLGNA